MSLIEIILLSIWLSMDAFAVCLSNGLVYKWFSRKNIITSVLTFWLFHFWMIIIWFFIGNLFIHFISNIDHRIALILLIYVWWWMIFDFIKSYKNKDTKYKNTSKTFNTKTLLLQSLAVSVDAIAVWLSFSALNGIKIRENCIIISITCIIFCLLWFLIGKKFWKILKHRSLLLWWTILIWIWIKVFLEHML